MKIEVGKCYATRGGKKVGPITAIEPAKTYQEMGVVVGNGGFPNRNRWWENGTASLRYESSEDLVAEWVESTPVREVTRLDLNAGRYGVLQIGEYVNGGVPLSFVTKTHYDASDVRAAIETLMAILPVLEQGN